MNNQIPLVDFLNALVHINYFEGNQGGRYLPAEDFGDASIADLQYARYVARSSTAVSQLDDLLPRGVWQWSAVDVNAAELVNPAVSCSRAPKY